MRAILIFLLLLAALTMPGDADTSAKVSIWGSYGSYSASASGETGDNFVVDILAYFDDIFGEVEMSMMYRLGQVTSL